MASISFSLTQRLIINPIMYFRADLNQSKPLPTIKKVYHFIEAQGFTRINALFSSVFAAADAFIHFSTGCYKGTRLLLGVKSSYNKSEVTQHFRRTILYSTIALIGTVAAVIWPGIVKFFKPSPMLPFQKDVQPAMQIPSDISDLLNHVDMDMKQGHPITKLLQTKWKHFDLTAKHWFVLACDQHNPEGSYLYSTIRKVMATTVYRPIGRAEREVQWLNDEEMTKNFKCAHEEDFGYYFHTTSEATLKSILKNRKIEVRYEKAFHAAFVSTNPDLTFGKCVVVFNSTIERLSDLRHGFTLNDTTYWAGFSQDIPLSDLTLSCIAINSEDENERSRLEKLYTLWAGRDISVVLIKDIILELNQIRQRNVGIPAEWPEEGEAAGMNIIRAMKRAFAIPEQQNEPTACVQPRPKGMPALLRQTSMDHHEFIASRYGLSS